MQLSHLQVDRWLAYFEENKENRTTVGFPDDVSMDDSTRLPLLRSIQKFQIGETGDGKHLRKYAKQLNDPTYERCIDLFIKEEQSHARILAEMIAALDGTLLSWHWTDIAFVCLRRMLGLKTELFILLIAEIVGKCFYLQCARTIPNQRMSNAFSLIVLDEIAHLEFHCEFLRTQLERLPQGMQYLVYCIWSAMFHAACFVFILDHRKALSVLSTTPSVFLRDCSLTFHRAATMCFSLNQSSEAT